ncbi:MAG: exopolysaccharide biosynthesis protein [Betaproteobacteria bacterium]|nr:exopolysaccharide biosynthesis protein [Betaproteobacteria bacterium]
MPSSSSAGARGVIDAAFIRRFVREARRRRLDLQRGRPGDPLTLQQLLDLHGRATLPVLLIVLALITTVPVAGAGMLFSLAIMVWAWRWLRRRESLQGLERLNFLQISPRAASRCLRWLAGMYLFAGRWLRPRWAALFSSRLRGFWSLWVALMAFIIFLPIPFGNLFPAVSLLMLGLGLLTRDGLMLVLSLLLGLGGLGALIAAAGWLGQILMRAWTSAF